MIAYAIFSVLVMLGCLWIARNTRHEPMTRQSILVDAIMQEHRGYVCAETIINARNQQRCDRATTRQQVNTNGDGI